MKKNESYHKLLSLRKEKIAPFIDKADNTSRAVTLVINTARKALNQWCKISHYSRTEDDSRKLLLFISFVFIQKRHLKNAT